MEKEISQKVYSIKGEEVGNITLPASVFNKDLKKSLVSQTVVSLRKNLQSSTTHTKDRSEKRGGGRKPWRQKGTGRARHGSIRSPIWRGGGVTHGPRKEKVHSSKVNRQVKRSAFSMVLSAKLRDNELIFVDKISVASAKTKDLVTSVKSLLKEKTKGSLLLVVANSQEEILRAARNIQDLRVKPAINLTVLDLLSFKYIAIEKEALDMVVKRFIKKEN